MNIFLVFIFYLGVAILINAAKKKNKGGEDPVDGMGKRPAAQQRKPSGPVLTSDGHTLKKEKDITCRRLFGHGHPEDSKARYLVHDDPGGEEYIVLNGVRLRLKEADQYFCR